MKKIFLAAAILGFLSGCDDIDNLLAVPKKMDNMNKTTADMDAGMKKTNAAIHDQQLMIPLKEMENKDNWDVLTPIPFKILPYGKKFAEAATAEELIELSYKYLKQIGEASLTAGMDNDGNDIPYNKTTLEYKNAVREKQALLTIVQVLAGFAPQATVNLMIEKYLYGVGEAGSLRYEKTAYQFLYLRYIFIHDVLIESSLTSEPLSNVGMVEQAIIYTQQLDQIAREPFGDRVVLNLAPSLYVSVCTTTAPVECKPGYESLDFSGKMNPKLTFGEWKKIKVAMDTDLVNGRAVDPSRDAELTARERQKTIEAQRTVQEYLQYWENRP
jgi:hypothetical protein